MTLAELKERAVDLSAKERRELIAFLVAQQAAQDHAVREKLAAKIDDPDPAHWIELEDLTKRFAE